jgi:hypothetical protein
MNKTRFCPLYSNSCVLPRPGVVFGEESRKEGDISRLASFQFQQIVSRHEHPDGPGIARLTRDEASAFQGPDHVMDRWLGGPYRTRALTSHL